MKTLSKTANYFVLAATWMVAGCAVAADGGDDGATLGSSALPLRADSIRVLTLNVRIDEAKSSGLERFQTRRPRINSVIRSINPDVIGLQEVEDHFWDDIKSDFSDYHSTFFRRGGPASPNEGVALLVRKARFNDFDCNACKEEKTLVYAERATCITDDLANRNVIRVKVVDKVTSRTLDIFNTHFPSGKDCDKKRMARKVARWVEDYGDNVILMGDFNTGYSLYGSRQEPYSELLSTSSVPLYNAYRSIHDVSYGESFITDKADTPERRLGSMIDHIMFGPGYVVDDAGINRSLFSGSSRINCDDAHSVYDEPYPLGSILVGGERQACLIPPVPIVLPVSTLKSYSDHWAVWADLRRIDCPNGC